MRGTRFSEFEALDIMARCPRFEGCSAPSCPLDLRQEERAVLKGEPRCTLGKTRRKRIGAGTPLPRKGMTKREWAAGKAWDRLPEEEKELRRARGRALSSLSPCVQKGHQNQDRNPSSPFNA